LKLLKDLTDTIEEPEYSFGRPQASQKEMLYCCALKVYTQFSTRRANTDIVDAHEKGYLTKPHHYNTIIKYFDNANLTPIIQNLIQVSSAPLKSVETEFAVDSSGLRTTKFSEYCKEKHGERKEHDWVKLHICTGVKTNIICSAEVTHKDGADTVQFKPLVQQVADNGFSIDEISADKAYSSRSNLETVKASL